MAERFTGRLADVIRRPLITEKATRALDLNQYTFEVDHRAAKPDIKAAVVSLRRQGHWGQHHESSPSFPACGSLCWQTCPSQEGCSASGRWQLHPVVS